MPHYAARADVLVGNSTIRLARIVKAKDKRLAVIELLRQERLDKVGTLLTRSAKRIKVTATFNPYKETKL